VVCVGAEPVAITNCLNFGNPYDPEVFWQFKEAVRGMGDACTTLNTPVTGGNVSFHNESQNFAVFPTPTIGMLGMIEDLNKTMSAGFKNECDIIYIIGNKRDELGGSEYLKVIFGEIAGDAPVLDIHEEIRLQKCVLQLIKKSIINSAHDISEGGLAICLAEKAIMSNNNLGAEIFSGEIHSDAALFGESQSRIIVSLNGNNISSLKRICSEHNVQCSRIGNVSNEKFSISDSICTTVSGLRRIYETAIPDMMK